MKKLGFALFLLFITTFAFPQFLTNSQRYSCSQVFLFGVWVVTDMVSHVDIEEFDDGSVRIFVFYRNSSNNHHYFAGRADSGLRTRAVHNQARTLYTGPGWVIRSDRSIVTDLSEGPFNNWHYAIIVDRERVANSIMVLIRPPLFRSEGYNFESTQIGFLLQRQ